MSMQQGSTSGLGGLAGTSGGSRVACAATRGRREPACRGWETRWPGARKKIKTFIPNEAGSDHMSQSASSRCIAATHR